MTGGPAPIALTAHLALVSSVSFGGFPTVLPDVRNFVVGAHHWLSDQEFADIFAIAQSIPGPNMILMMSFVGWKVWGFPGAVASAFATFGPPARCISPRSVMPRGGAFVWCKACQHHRARSGCDGRAVWRRHSRNRRVARAAGPL
jgi:hypothetical protein